MRAIFASLVAPLILLAAAACGSSPTGIVCMDPPSTGPLSEACATCGMTNCAMLEQAVESSCATLVSCIEGCSCSDASCAQGCNAVATSTCQMLLRDFQDCEESATPCIMTCSVL